jgi:protein-histidine N-methyltransferase
LDDGTALRLPRRELWDVRVQLMAEDDGKEGVEGLGEHDVKTGVYEGGFKSWESSVDLVKVLAAEKSAALGTSSPLRVIEVRTLCSVWSSFD